MSYRVEISKTAPEGWDNLVKSVPEGHLFQTTYWADYMKHRCNSDPFFLRIYQDNDLVGQLLFLKRNKYSSFFISKRLELIDKLLKPIFGTYSWEYGPILLENSDALTKYFSIIIRRITKNKLAQATLPIHSKKYSLIPCLDKKLWGTVLLNLDCTSEEIYLNINKSTRKNIRRLIQKGIKIKIAESPKDLIVYAELLGKSKKRSSSVTLKTITYLKKYLENKFQVFIAQQANRPISAMAVLMFNCIVSEQGIARSTYEKKHKMYTQDLLKWAVIDYALKNKEKLYDFMGVNPISKNRKEQGILKYKLKWGGELKEYLIFKSSECLFK